MEKLRLLIVDDNVQYCDSLAAYFGGIELFDVLPAAYSGIEAVQICQQAAPDVMILDMVMPELDGIGVLQQLRELALADRIRIFANSPYADDAMVKLSQSLGVNYFMLKPMPAGYVFSRIMDVLRPEQMRFTEPLLEKYRSIAKAPVKDLSREQLIVNYLRLLGVPAHISGYLLLKNAIEYHVEHYGKNPCVTTETYPYVALMQHSAPGRVERNIRHAIEYAWDHGNFEAQRKLFGYTVNDTKGRPTNKEFIAMITDRVVMQMKYR